MYQQLAEAVVERWRDDRTSAIRILQQLQKVFWLSPDHAASVNNEVMEAMALSMGGMNQGCDICADPDQLVEWKDFAAELVGEQKAMELLHTITLSKVASLMHVCEEDPRQLRQDQVAFLKMCFGTPGLVPETISCKRAIFEHAIGELTVISDPPVLMKRGEEAYFVSDAQVVRQRTKTFTRRAYAGTRVKIGSLPLYIGGSTPVSTQTEVHELVGDAQFVITNTRVIVAGTKVNYSIRLDKILNVEGFTDALQIMYEGRYGGHYYLMGRALEAKTLLDVLLKDFAHGSDNQGQTGIEAETHA